MPNPIRTAIHQPIAVTEHYPNSSLAKGNKVKRMGKPAEQNHILYPHDLSNLETSGIAPGV
jgi:hypothetical protein